MPRKTVRALLYGVLFFDLAVSSGITAEKPPSGPDEQQLLTEKLLIYKLKSQDENGGGYKLIYLVDVLPDVFWRFKTDFDNDFLVGNKYIISHRFVSRRRNAVITEDIYSNKPEVTFRWQTTLPPSGYRLTFELLNPEECGQKYHYGYIQLEAFGQKTKVTQVAYFDFSGVSFWVNYPFYGGMYDFLKYTALWEQQTILELKDRYVKKTEE